MTYYDHLWPTKFCMIVGFGLSLSICGSPVCGEPLLFTVVPLPVAVVDVCRVSCRVTHCSRKTHDVHYNNITTTFGILTVWKHGSKISSDTHTCHLAPAAKISNVTATKWQVMFGQSCRVAGKDLNSCNMGCFLPNTSAVLFPCIFCCLTLSTFLC